MREEAFTALYGTMEYYPPEYSNEGRYHGEAAMVWALGVLMFALLCGRLPDAQDLARTVENVWISPGLSKKCCKLVCSFLQPDPERRIKLWEILGHAWFKKKSRINSALFVPYDAPTSPLKRFWKLLAFLKRKNHSPQEHPEEEEQEQVPVLPAPPSNSQNYNQEEAQRPTADAEEEASSTELQEASIVCRALSFLLRPLQSLVDQLEGLEEVEPQPVAEEEAEEAVEEAEQAVENASSQGPPKKRFLRLRSFIKNAKDRLSVTRRGEVSVTAVAHSRSEVFSVLGEESPRTEPAPMSRGTRARSQQSLTASLTCPAVLWQCHRLKPPSQTQKSSVPKPVTQWRTLKSGRMRKDGG
ncbi:hypothetical protein DNTS_034775 [Danionella cerebrum]|uniref:non-specific serine/threonine protein kinase n=1 Tax=Danionella cerebrum TaxID=2873325 RepID=A0A553MXW0_9TELE|nr:hypothetical protein DNTS_034775 [Danionella translucida]